MSSIPKQNSRRPFSLTVLAALASSSLLSAGLREDSVDVGIGWLYSDWFEYFTPAPFFNKAGWIYSDAHEWLFVDESSGDLWMWAPASGWLWVDEDFYPLVYFSETDEWALLDEKGMAYSEVKEVEDPDDDVAANAEAEADADADADADVDVDVDVDNDAGTDTDSPGEEGANAPVVDEIDAGGEESDPEQSTTPELEDPEGTGDPVEGTPEQGEQTPIVGPIPVEPDGGIGDGAGPIPDGGLGGEADPIPVEPDGGIGDGAGSIPNGGIGGGADPIPVEPNDGIGDGAGPIPSEPADDATPEVEDDSDEQSDLPPSVGTIGPPTGS